MRWFSSVILIAIIIVVAMQQTQRAQERKVAQAEIARAWEMYQEASADALRYEALVKFAGPAPDSSDWVLMAVWLRKTEVKRRGSR